MSWVVSDNENLIVCSSQHEAEVIQVLLRWQGREMEVNER